MILRLLMGVRVCVSYSGPDKGRLSCYAIQTLTPLYRRLGPMPRAPTPQSRWCSGWRIGPFRAAHLRLPLRRGRRIRLRRAGLLGSRQLGLLAMEIAASEAPGTPSAASSVSVATSVAA